MPFIQVGKENSGDIELYYEDHGEGKPTVLIHGYPQSGAAWEKQLAPLLQAGRRVITYDRRGFGKSSQPTSGYDYDTFAADLNQLMTQLKLRDATLAGHSMGTGEICRYFSKYGSERVENAVFVSPLQPFLLKTEDNPEGLAKSVFEGFQKHVTEDRFAFLKAFFSNFYSSGDLGNNAVSEQAVQSSFNVAASASATATYECIASWMTDFRRDLPAITVPSLIIHGTADQVIPFANTAPRMQKAIQGSVLIAIEDAPHSLPWTHAERINREIIGFISGKIQGRSAA